MAWFRKQKKPLKASDKRDVPADVFDKCAGCGEILYRERLAQNQHVCDHCGFHFRISGPAYVSLLSDPDTFEEQDRLLTSEDPLGFVDSKPYHARVEAARAKTGRNSAIITGTARLNDIPVVLACMDFTFIGGSMGSVVGEKIARAARVSLDTEAPLIIVSASGGARMQEGTLSLMQLAKTSAILAQLHERGIPFVSVLTDPTTGGVTASFAMLGDVNIAEPGALIGFAGPRVIQETIKQDLPDGFQRSDFLREHGMVDLVVDRRELKDAIALQLRFMHAGFPDDL